MPLSGGADHRRTRDAKTAKGTPPGASGAPQRVIFIRHGERLDEADRKMWAKLLRESEVYESHDPPLTATGKAQAAAAGAFVKEYLRETGAGGGGWMLFSSPARRTLTTAEMVAREIEVEALTVVHGLYGCTAAAVHYGLPSLKCANPRLVLQSGRDDAVDVDAMCGSPTQTYMEGVREAVREASAQGKIAVVVTHREGIRDLSEAIGVGRVPVPYCCAHEFHYSLESDSWRYITHINAGRAV